MITDEQLAEWELLANEATAGPWAPSLSVKDGLPRFQILGGDRMPYGYGFAIVHGTIEDGNIIPESCDLDFIAASRTAVPALIAEVRRLLEENERLDMLTRMASYE